MWYGSGQDHSFLAPKVLGLHWPYTVSRFLGNSPGVHTDLDEEEHMEILIHVLMQVSWLKTLLNACFLREKLVYFGAYWKPSSYSFITNHVAGSLQTCCASTSVQCSFCQGTIGGCPCPFSSPASSSSPRRCLQWKPAKWIILQGLKTFWAFIFREFYCSCIFYWGSFLTCSKYIEQNIFMWSLCALCFTLFKVLASTFSMIVEIFIILGP